MKLNSIRTIALMSIVLLWSGVTTAQNIKVDERQSQLLMAATQTTTLQKELDQAGAKGFHIVLGTSRGNSEIVLMLERDINSPEQHQFKLIATNATKSFQQEITEAGRQGFRAVASTFMNKPGFLGVGTEIIVILERPVRPSRYYEYKLLAADRTSTLESEWRIASTEGYRAIGALPRSEVMILMEREAQQRKP